MIELPPEIRAFEAWLRVVYPELSERQVQVAILREYGLTQAEISERLGVSQKTISCEMQKISGLKV